MILVGLLAASLDGRGAARRPPSGILWAVACAGFIALYHLCGKRALAGGSPPAAPFALSLSVAVPVNVASLGSSAMGGMGRSLRQRPAPIVVAGLLCTLSFVLFLHGLKITGAGLALTLRNTSVLFAQAMAWAIGERLTARGVTGAILVFLGAALLAWPRA